MNKIAFLFSGQGSQTTGMMKELYETCGAAKAVFDTADRVLRRSISKLCFEDSQEKLNLTHNTQPCMLASDLASFAAVKECGIIPDAVAGFSLGEYAALVAAEVISIDDAFNLIQLRADAMQEAVPVGVGAMAAIVGLDSEAVNNLCNDVTDGYVIAANYNSPVQTVVSGTVKGVAAVGELAQQKGAKFIILPVSAPFHSALMKPAAEKLGEALEKISFCDPQIPVYMNCTGVPLKKASFVKELLVKQAYSPVLWVQTLENMYCAGCNVFIECGAGKTLSGLAKKTLKGKEVKIGRVENLKTLAEAKSILTT